MTLMQACLVQNFLQKCCFRKHKCAIILPADYNEVKYNVVANPRLVFSMNSFHKFNLSFLEFPGAK